MEETTEITEIQWKNLRAVRLENNILSVVILPSLGGKIASVYRKDIGFEFAAQNEEKVYRMPEFGSDFSEYDASGLDEAFPNIVAADMLLDGRRYCFPDHGEIWSCSFETHLDENGVKLHYDSAAFGYQYEKKVVLSDEMIILEFDIRNREEKPLPCIWTFHGLMHYEEDMELLYGEDVRMFRNVLKSRELGEIDQIYRRKGDGYDFERVPAAGCKTMVKYYAEGRRNAGFCGYRYPSKRAECRYHYNPEKIPYLGVWVTAGGFRGDYNCAFEPANGYYDDIRIAEKNGSLYYLKKDQPLQFTLSLQVSKY